MIIDMAADKQAQRIVALDIGTNKIAAIVANVNAQGELEIIGIGTHQSRGLKRASGEYRFHSPINPARGRRS